MSQANVELWQQGVDAWNRGDREAFLSLASPEWEFRTSGVFPGLKPVYRGRTGASELWADMRDPWRTFEVTVERVEDLGDRILALVTFVVEGRDGLKTSRRWAYLVRVVDGRLGQTDNFSTWDKALEAAGLSE
jgi:ketosteroid isomerase-like protein